MILPLVLVIVATPVGLIVRQLDHRADIQRNADHLVRSIQLDAANIRALEWEARALKGPTPRLFAEATAANVELGEHVDALTRNGDAPTVTGPAIAYRLAYRQLLLSARSATTAELAHAYVRNRRPCGAPACAHACNPGRCDRRRE